MSRFGLVAVATVAIAAGCGGASASGSLAPSLGEAKVTVTFAGGTYELTGGRCEAVGVLGWKVTAGDYDYDLAQGGEGDFVELFVSQEKITGGVQGRLGGVPWALSGGPGGSMGSNMRGTFWGTDSVTDKPISGTFACS